ncbi:MAG TPA: hypothetical protein VG366_05215 [Solirubrobacteraceae bacterium]|nr:hypothetical protein [Solirubrobacteraceae bacterium]
MNRALKRRLALAVGLCALVAGGTVAAFAATSPAGHRRAAATIPRDLSTAAGYLGVAPAQLQAQLRSGKTLAQVAAATPGKSEAGLIAAIVAVRQAKLAAISAKLGKRVKAEVDHTPGQGLPAVEGAYLGLTREQLRSEVRAGKTLAAIAAATPGKSEAGLIAAIVARRRATLAGLVKTGKLTQAQVNTRDAKLQAHVKRFVNHVPRRHASG